MKRRGTERVNKAAERVSKHRIGAKRREGEGDGIKKEEQKGKRRCEKRGDKMITTRQVEEVDAWMRETKGKSKGKKEKRDGGKG